MKYESFKDLPIGLNDCSNVIHCLKHFIKLETIGQSINYLCLKCKRKSKAKKHKAHFDTHTAQHPGAAAQAIQLLGHSWLQTLRTQCLRHAVGHVLLPLVKAPGRRGRRHLQSLWGSGALQLVCIEWALPLICQAQAQSVDEA